MSNQAETAFLILIAVRAVNKREVFGMHIDTVQLKRGAKPDSDASHLYARILSRWDNCYHHVARLKTPKRFRAWGVPFRKPERIGAAALAASVPGCLDVKRDVMRVKLDTRPAFSHTGCIDPVRFGVALPRAIKLRPATRADLNVQSSQLQPLPQRPAGCIQGGYVL